MRKNIHVLWKNWLPNKALPLWSRKGYDPVRRLYYERLTYTATPVVLPELRLMVQARQIATFCRAQLDGVFYAAEDALHCLTEVERRYWRCDGQAGWIFSLAENDAPASTVRDLYAHAFILFAYAWAYRLTSDKRLLLTVRQTIAEVENIFQAPNGGFINSVPQKETIRSQNPHMHLLEAYLALFEVTADQFYLDRAQALVSLALNKFICPQSGFLLEFFTKEWKPKEPFGENIVEPGHLFEWSWLLQETLRLCPDVRQKDAIITTAERLYDLGLRYGVMQQSVCDAINECGHIIEANTRIWPQTELIRLLASRPHKTHEEHAMLHAITARFFKSYAPQTLGGGWIDRLSEQGQPLVDYMPASSLYHIYGAAREFCAAP